MEVHAGPSAEYADVAALKGLAEKASATVDLAQEVFDCLESIVRHYDDIEDVSAPAVTARNTLIRAERPLTRTPNDAFILILKVTIFKH